MLQHLENLYTSNKEGLQVAGSRFYVLDYTLQVASYRLLNRPIDWAYISLLKVNKAAIVTFSIHKSDDNENAKNYRGITWSNRFGKLFDKILYIRIKHNSESKHISKAPGRREKLS